MPRLLKGRSFPGKILITRRAEPLDQSVLHSPTTDRRSSESDIDYGKQVDRSTEDDRQSRSSTNASSSVDHTKSLSMSSETTSKEINKSTVGARATDSARLMKFTKELSGSAVILDRKEGILRRKYLEYLDFVAQYYDILDTERTDEEINMLSQIAVDCPRTVPDVSFFQQVEVQKSLERILYIWLDAPSLIFIVLHLIDDWVLYFVGIPLGDLCVSGYDSLPFLFKNDSYLETFPFC